MAGFEQRANHGGHLSEEAPIGVIKDAQRLLAVALAARVQEGVAVFWQHEAGRGVDQEVRDRTPRGMAMSTLNSRSHFLAKLVDLALLASSSLAKPTDPALRVISLQFTPRLRDRVRKLFKRPQPVDRATDDAAEVNTSSTTFSAPDSRRRRPRCILPATDRCERM